MGEEAEMQRIKVVRPVSHIVALSDSKAQILIQHRGLIATDCGVLGCKTFSAQDPQHLAQSLACGRRSANRNQYHKSVKQSVTSALSL